MQDIKDKKVTDARGLVISCLKDNIDKISVECEDQITVLLEQEVEDYQLDPLLNKHCQSDIAVLCGDEPNDMVGGELGASLMTWYVGSWGEPNDMVDMELERFVINCGQVRYFNKLYNISLHEPLRDFTAMGSSSFNPHAQFLVHSAE